MTYTVKYKKPEWLFWRKIKNVKGDGILFGKYNNVPVRYFILLDDSRIEFPMTMMFMFGPDRCMMIERDIQKEAGG